MNSIDSERMGRPSAAETLRRDISAIFARDPAAISLVEVLLAYPGLHAILLHRLAHWFCGRGVRVIPRLISHLSRLLSGIEIHPAASIGAGFFVDHGMGVVIGETAEIGEDVMLYQGVTLGGRGDARGKRHPTLGNGVTVGVGAKVLGAVTVGQGAIIGAGAVVLDDVPPNATVVGVPGRVVSVRDPESGRAKDVERTADFELGVIRRLNNKVYELEKRLEQLEGSDPSHQGHHGIVGKLEKGTNCDSHPIFEKELEKPKPRVANGCGGGSS